MWYERYFTKSFCSFICIEQMFKCFLTLFSFKINNFSVFKRQAKVINHAATIVQWHGAFYRPIDIILMWHAKHFFSCHVWINCTALLGLCSSTLPILAVCCATFCIRSGCFDGESLAVVL